jgi:hypothetical protein
MSKLRIPKPISQAVGPTYTINDPIKFSNGGGHKMKAAKPDVDDSTSAERPNKTLIPTMNADVPPKGSKIMGTRKWFDPFKESKGTNASEGHTVAGSDKGLKSSYEK